MAKTAVHAGDETAADSKPHPHAALLGELDSIASRAAAAARQHDLPGLSQTVHDLTRLLHRHLSGQG